MNQYTLETLREMLEADGSPVPSGEWDQFTKQFAAAVRTAHDELEDGEPEDAVVHDLGLQFDAWRTARRRPRRVGPVDDRSLGKADPRWRALAEILAERARQDRDLRWFRGERLAGRLLQPTGVAEWVEAQGVADGRPTKFITLPLRDDGRPQTERQARRSSGVAWSWRLLKWAIQGQEDVQARTVAAGGVLDELRIVAARVAALTGWAEPVAVAFILTDVTPHAPLARSTISEGPVSWVTLAVNPLIPLTTVVDLWKRLRLEALGDAPDAERRVRKLSEKTATLAVFWEMTAGEPIGQRRREWNHKHRKWRYTGEQAGQFHRDGKKAYLLVMGREPEE